MQHSDRQNPGTTQPVAQEPDMLISAWMDGDSQTLMPDSVFTATGRETWQIYHLIGDSIRTPELVRPVSAQFHLRLAAAIAAEPVPASPAAAVAEQTAATVESGAAQIVHTAAQPVVPEPVRIETRPHRNPLRTGWRLVWPGLAMAAAVASVVWMARPFFIPEAAAPAQQMASADNTGGKSPAMRDYVSAHRQVAGPTGVRQVSFGASR